jgi:lysophospholipase L1-like esterase
MKLSLTALFRACRCAAAAMTQHSTALNRQRRGSVLGGAALAAALALPAPALHAQNLGAEHWVGSWGAGAAGQRLPARTQTFTDQTLRLIVQTSIGGNKVRIRLSNEMGTTPLRIGAAHVAVRANGAEIVPGTDRPLTFSGFASITVPPGAPVLSDPVELNVAPFSELAVSVYLPGMVAATTIHGSASRTGYVSLPGDFTGAATLPTQRTILYCPFLSTVDVDSTGAAIVTLGDSVTDGTLDSASAGNRTGWLARRLQGVRDQRLGLVNRGIGGNRLLSNPPEGPQAGRNMLERFDRDVLATAGVRSMTVMLGIHDIGYSSATNPVTANDLIGGYRQLIARAHASGIAVYGATLTPFEGASYYSPEKERVRQAVNDWIRNHGEFDGIMDFDQVTRDPGRSTRLLPAYDSGDHLHPNELGYEAMGNAVPAALLRPVK